jgi:hypothetical protein
MKLTKMYLILNILNFSRRYDVKFYVISSRVGSGVLSSAVRCCVIYFGNYSHIILLLVFSFYVCFLLSS